MEMIFGHDEYNALMHQTFLRCIELGKLKGGEYAGGEDRLENFRRNAEECGILMETCWRVYAGKHWDAITQYVKDIQTGKSRVRLESLDGRADDMIVYLILFKCMLRERERQSMQAMPEASKEPESEVDVLARELGMYERTIRTSKPSPQR